MENRVLTTLLNSDSRHSGGFLIFRLCVAGRLVWVAQVRQIPRNPVPYD
jgi:hypothetical protein